ncbi:hypothetical protein ER308_09320 [Egibacter rhizosphaerae]|uniref:Uncharacterized protein n=1 Tax=Egibacter rhizosphaerae TaxID=1670831 RepID=A0A411YEV1_9ACTN|nr:hypothetical protein [Egibacter rhizosphaerae]QBI19729.1 hypothetical protein ER308_09320 [Egibacter rhizosphaerae]
MTMPTEHPQRLDPLLDAWGRRHALSQTRTAEIREAVLRDRGPAEERDTLPATWWLELSRQVTASIVTATAVPRTAVDRAYQAVPAATVA